MRFAKLAVLLIPAVILATLGACGGGASSVATSWGGTKQLGAAGGDTVANGVATDAGGNVYVAGHTTAGLDGNKSSGGSDYFFTKFDSAGNRIYTRQIGVSGSTAEASSIATDTSSNVYVAGVTNAGLDGNTLTGIFDFFVAKFDSSGNKLYTRQLGAAGAGAVASSVAVDAGGNVYVAGYVAGGGLDGNKLTGTIDFFFTKYDNLGNKLYTRQLGVAGKDTYGRSVAADADGNVYVAGQTYGGLDGNTLIGTHDAFVTKYDSAGNKLYTRQLGIAGSYIDGIAAATDIGGNVFVAGAAYAGLDGNVLTGLGDMYLVKYNGNGNKFFTQQLGVANQYTTGMAVATDASGNVYVTGMTEGGLDGNTLSGHADLFVTKFDHADNKVYTRQLGVSGANTQGNAIATDASGNVFVAGDTTGGLDGNTFVGTNYDFFVAKYNSSGVKQ